MAENTDERTFGPIGSKVIFEDERTRVWKLLLQPGEETPIHRHELDYLLIQISGDRIAVVPEADSESPYKDYMEADVRPGQITPVPRGGIERARNVGAEPYHEIIVELKD